MRVVVTGAFGMLGYAVLCELAKHKHEVLAIDHGAERIGQIRDLHSNMPGLEVADIDILDKTALAAKTKQFKPDWVLNLAAYTDVDGCERDPRHADQVNNVGARNVALAAKAARAPILTVSTDYVFDGRSKVPYRELQRMAPLSVYGRTKMKGERAVRETSRRHIVLRTSWLFGLGGRNFVDTIVRKAKAGEALRVVNDQRGCPTYTVDLSRAMIELIEKKQFGTFHVCSTGDCTWFEFADAIVEAIGKNVPLSPITSQEVNRPAKRPTYSVLNTTRFKRVTGHSLENWRSALQRYLGGELWQKD